MENKFLKLTNTVYKVLEFFPESDPLKNRAKDKALAITEHLILINETSGWASFQKEKIKVQLSEDIDILLGYLWIGKSQGWLNSANCLILSNEYEKIKKEIGPIIQLAGSGNPASQEIIGKELPFSGNLPMPDEASQKLPGIENPLVLQKSTQTAPKSVLDNTGAATPSFNISARQRKILEFLSKNEKAQVMDMHKVLPDITKRTIRRDLDELLEADKIIRLGNFNQIFYRLK